MSNDDRLAWLDLETFGLEPSDPIIEVGMVLTDLDLNIIDEFSILCWEQSYEEHWEIVPQVVRDMHTKSGLIERARKEGYSRSKAEAAAVQWLKHNKATNLPMCGNSIATDKAWLREQMSELLDTFHYRVIDVSSYKEGCRRYNPKVFAAAPAKGLAHTALADIYESIKEFGFYLDNFIFDGRD